MDEKSREARRFLFVLQILVVSLVAGLVIFGGVVIMVGSSPSGPSPPSPTPGAPFNVLRAIAWGIVAIGLVVAFVLPRSLAGGLRRDETVTEDRRRAAFTTITIITCALIESGGLLGAVTALLSGDATDAIVTGAAAVGILLQFPTRGRWRRFVEATGGDVPSGGFGRP